MFYSQESPSGESTTRECGVNYQLLEVMLLTKPYRLLQVAVDHCQLLTMASETVDPIDWPLPPTLHRVIPLELLHVLYGANAGHKLQDLQKPAGLELATIEMPGQHIQSDAEIDAAT